MPFCGVAVGVTLLTTQLQQPSVQGPRSDESNVELILLDVLYNHLRLEAALSALQDNRGRRFLPIRQLSNALGFRVHVDCGKHTIVGFLSEPADRIALNGSTGRAVHRGKDTSFDPTMVFERDNDLYLDADLVEKLAGLHFEWRLNRLELDVSSDAPLPVRQQWLVRRMFERMKQPAVMPVLPVVSSPYGLWTLPALEMHWYADATLDNSRPSTVSRLQVEGRGDLLFMDARYRYISASGSKPAALFATLGRQDPRSGLLGSLHATQFSLGDLNLVSLPLFARARSGVGFTVSNFPLPGSRASNGDAIEGRAPPGSTVELYRGSELLAAVRTDEDGKYSIPPVPLEPGPNDVRIVTIAGDGDVREESRTLFGDTAGPRPGENQYRITAARVGSSIVPGSANAISNEQKRTELIGEYRFGLSPSSWLSMTGAETFDRSSQTAYLGLGYHAWSGANLLRLDGMFGDNGGSAFSAGVSRRVGAATLSVDHTLLSRSFGSNFFPEFGSGVSSVTRLRLDGSVGNGRRPISYGFGVDQTTGSSATTIVRSRVGGGDGQTFVANSFTAQLGRGPIDVTGLAQVRHDFGSTLGRLDLGYVFRGGPSLETARLSFDRRLGMGYRTRFGLDYDATRPGRLQTIGTLYRLLGPFELGLNLAVDARGSLKANLLFSVGLEGDDAFHSMSFARPGALETGSVAARVFLDRNYNGIYDAGDRLLPNVSLKASGRTAIGKSGADGVCYVDRLASNQEVSVSLNEDSFTDPCWAPVSKGVLAIPRSGRITRIDLGIIEAAEIEGKAVHAAPGLTAQLVNYLGQVAHVSVLDDSATFVFSHVRPGDYTLRLVDSGGRACGERPIRVAPAAMMKDCDIEAQPPRSDAQSGG